MYRCRDVSKVLASHLQTQGHCEQREYMERSRVPREDADFLQSVRKYVEDRMRDVREPCHVMIYTTRAETKSTFFSDENLRVKLIRLCEKYAETLSKKEILSVRILVSPKNCEPQGWHLDYRGELEGAKTIFVALTQCDETNSTEYLEFHSERDKCLFEQNVRSKSSNTSVPVRNVIKKCLIMKPHDIVFMDTSHIPHRRGPTFQSQYTRIVLNIDVSDIKELHTYYDSDFVDSLANGSIASRKVVDNLHSEVVVEVPDHIDIDCRKRSRL